MVQRLENLEPIGLGWSSLREAVAQLSNRLYAGIPHHSADRFQGCIPPSLVRLEPGRGAGAAVAMSTQRGYRFALPPANHVFLAGHRIMVQVQSSWFPLYDRNP